MSGIERWRNVASELDSHKTSALRKDLGMASCSLWKPSDGEVETLKEVAKEESLEIFNQASGPSVPGGTSFTVRAVDTDTD